MRNWTTRILALATFMTVTAVGPLPWSALRDEAARQPVFESGSLAADWPVRVLPRLEQMTPPLTQAEIERVLGAVDECSRQSQLNPLLVLAVIQVESRFDPYAVSPAGALGLMQLRPRTAQAVAEEIGVAWTSDEILFDPEVNVLLGTTYLKQLLDRFGDLDVALAAFNSGPTRISLRHRSIGAVPLAYPDRVWDVLVDLQAGAHEDPLLARRIS